MSREFVGKSELNYDPDPWWARVFEDIDNSEESEKAVNFLRSVGFCVTTLPAGGIIGPRLKVGINIFQGLGEIKEFVKGRLEDTDPDLLRGKGLTPEKIEEINKKYFQPDKDK